MAPWLQIKIEKFTISLISGLIWFYVIVFICGQWQKNSETKETPFHRRDFNKPFHYEQHYF